MSLLDNMPHVATAKRRTRTRDSLGGGKDTWTTLWSGRACWRQQATASEVMSCQQRGQTVTHKVFFHDNPNVDERDELVIGSDTMEVSSVTHPDASAGLGVLWRVMVNLVTNVT